MTADNNHNPGTGGGAGAALPLMSLALVLGLFLAAWLARPPAGLLLGLALAGMALVSWRDPWQGLVVLFLAWPFFLGASSRPGFFVLQWACWLWLICGAWGLHRRGRLAWARPPWPLLLFGALWLACLPLAGSEAWWKLWTLTPRLALTQFLLPSPPYALYPLTQLVDMATWLAMFSLAAPLLARADAARLRGLVRGLALVGLAVGLASLWLYFDRSDGGSFYNLSLEGRHASRLSGFAFNRQYMATYLILALPLVGCGWFMPNMGAPWRWLCAATAALLLVCLALTGQKAPLLVVALQAAALAFLVPGWPWHRRLLVLLVPLAAMAALDWLLLDSQLLRRLGAFSLGTNPYFEAWSLAWEMFKTSPLMGVGTGQWNPWTTWLQQAAGVRDWTLPFMQGSAHNQYLQVLAEQGLAGLAAWLLLVAWVLGAGCKAVRREVAPLLLAALLALVGWLAFGLLQSMLYFRVFGLAFFLLLAFVFPRPPAGTGPVLTQRKLVLGCLALALLLGWRGVQINAHQPRPGFFAGLYGCLELPNGDQGRQMGARAVLVVPAQPRGARLRAMALPEGGGKLWVQRAGETPRGISLPSGQWRELPLELADRAASPYPVFLWVDRTRPSGETGWLRRRPALGALLAVEAAPRSGRWQCP